MALQLSLVDDFIKLVLFWLKNRQGAF